MMMTTIGRLADRLLLAVVPKAAAGACPCGGNWCGSQGCGDPRDLNTYRIFEGCHCNIIKKECTCY